MINPLAVIFEQVRVWVLPNRRRPDRGRGGRRLARPAAGRGDLRRRLRLRRLDLQARSAAHRRGPLARFAYRQTRAGCWASTCRCHGCGAVSRGIRSTVTESLGCPFGQDRVLADREAAQRDGPPRPGRQLDPGRAGGERKIRVERAWAARGDAMLFAGAAEPGPATGEHRDRERPREHDVGLAAAQPPTRLRAPPGCSRASRTRPRPSRYSAGVDVDQRGVPATSGVRAKVGATLRRAMSIAPGRPGSAPTVPSARHGRPCQRHQVGGDRDEHDRAADPERSAAEADPAQQVGRQQQDEDGAGVGVAAATSPRGRG